MHNSVDDMHILFTESMQKAGHHLRPLLIVPTHDLIDTVRLTIPYTTHYIIKEVLMMVECQGPPPLEGLVPQI